MSSRLKHNKRRNCGLLYEFLVRKMSKSLIEKDRASYKKALLIMKKHFSKGTQLAEEKKLFDAVASARNVSESIARGVVAEVKRAAKSLDHKAIDKAKSAAIRDIHVAFGKDFFSEYKIDSYKENASVQLLINSSATGNKIDESVMRLQLEEYLMTRMSVLRDPSVAPRVGGLVYGMAIKGFNDRYRESLSTGQKSFLAKYVAAASSSDPRTAVSRLVSDAKQRAKVAISRGKLMKEAKEDKLLFKKLDEAAVALDMIDERDPGESGVEEILLFVKLVEEISSDE